ELRRQVADLQSLKEVSELRQLRDLNPRRIVGKSILGDQFSGGMTGFLGLNSDPKTAADGAGGADTAAASGGGTAQGTTPGDCSAPAGTTPTATAPASTGSAAATVTAEAPTPPTATELASRITAHRDSRDVSGTSEVWADGDST